MKIHPSSIALEFFFQTNNNDFNLHQLVNNLGSHDKELILS